MTDVEGCQRREIWRDTRGNRMEPGRGQAPDEGRSLIMVMVSYKNSDNAKSTFIQDNIASIISV